MSQQTLQGNDLDETEEALLRAFRDLRQTARTAAEWRTLGKFAHAKALEEEREYEAKTVAGIPGQLHLRIDIYDRTLVERMCSIYDRKWPETQRIRSTSNRTGGHRKLNDLGWMMMLKGLEEMDRELEEAPE